MIEKSSLRLRDLVTFGENSDGVNDFNLSSINLGSDVKGLEELSLLWVHTSGAWGQDDCIRGKGTNLSGSGSDMGIEDILDGVEVTVGEDEANVSNELISNNVKVRAALPRGLSLLVVVLSWVGLLSDVGDVGFHVNVLSHDQLGANLTHHLPHDANLLRGDVVNFDEKDLGVHKAGFLKFLPKVAASQFHLFISSLEHFVCVSVLVYLLVIRSLFFLLFIIEIR